MRKSEFEELIGQNVMDSDYEVIEKVYTFHPAVKEVSGKEEVAELYKSFGMSVFYDMLPRAERSCELEKKLRKVQAEANRIKEELEELSSGSIPTTGETATEVQEKHEIREILELMDETLTKYLRNPNITGRCKERARQCMEKKIDDIYRAFPPITLKGNMSDMES